MTKFAVTGSRHGMTQAQAEAFLKILWEGSVTELYHGMCCGVDTQVHYFALALGIEPHKYPGPDGEWTGKCLGGVLHTTNSFFARNRIIVDISDILIAIPKEMTSQNKGGTWYTYHYALKSDKNTYLIWPNGRVN